MRVALLVSLLVVQVISNQTTETDIEKLEIGDICPKGTTSFSGYHDPDEDGDECVQCMEGEYMDAEGGIEFCEFCEMGSYSNDLGMWECTLCPAGSINSEEGKDECYPCPAGQYSPNDGDTTCSNCIAGYYQDAAGSAGCKQCPEGHYQEKDSSTSCNTCPAGQSSDAESTSAAACFACAAGSFSASAGSPCDLCPVLTYNDEAGAAACKDCPANTDETGATICEAAPVDCDEGEVEVEGTCQACPAGSSAAKGATECTECAAGSYAASSGAGSCELCPVWTYGPTEGLVSCLDCETADEEGATECKVECPAGEVVAEDGVSCVPCAAGTYEQAGSCLPCDAGTFNDQTGATTCSACSPGFYSAVEGASSCSICPAATYQDKSGSAYCEDCLPGTYGTAAGQVECVECAIGFYNPEPKQESCGECPAGQITDQVGQQSCQDCEAGTFGKSNSECEQCPAGSYSGDDGATECTLCAAGTFASEAGRVFCETSPAGTYASEGAAAPTDCPAGSYCPEGSAAPTSCPVGTYSSTVSLGSEEECTSCPAGSYCATAGSTAPTGLCSAGYLCPAGSVEAEAVLCPRGQYCPAGSGEGSPCPVGTFSGNVGMVAADSCQACTAGFYCSSAGLTAPTGPCAAGYFCSSGASSSQEDLCPAGHYCPEGSASPASCPISTYNSNTGAGSVAACVACPEGKRTTGEGSTSVDDCQDVDCSPGFYRDAAGSCHICEKGTFSNVVNAVACRPCPKHQYNSAEGSVQCMKCPDTAFTWGTGTASFADCIGPIIEVCSEEGMNGTCHVYYDDNLWINTTVRSVNVIRGEFDLFEKTNLRARFDTLSEEDGPHNVAELETIGALESFAPVLNDVFCSLDKGWKFHGSVRTQSKSGKACINWRKTPLAHKAEPNHYCQNPDGTNLQAKPFCYISETETEECDIPACVWDMACFTGVGVHYRGSTRTTDHGRNCQNWNRDWPHIHGYHSPKYSWAGVGDHTNCRNPDYEGKPWCYTTNLFHRWEYCAIPRCSRDDFEFYKF